MSRRKGRYERRKEKRYGKRVQRSNEVGGLHEVFTYQDLTLLVRNVVKVFDGRTALNGLSNIYFLELP